MYKVKIMYLHKYSIVFTIYLQFKCIFYTCTYGIYVAHTFVHFLDTLYTPPVCTSGNPDIRH